MSDSSLVLPEPTGDAPAVANAMASAALAPTTLVLEAPAPVGAVTTTTASEAVPINAADRARLDSMVESYLDAVSNLDPHGTEFGDKVKDIGKLGDDDIRASASVSNRLLDKPLAAMQNGGLTETSSVGRSLLSLRRQVEDLDPAKQGDLLSPRKLLGLLPFGAGDKLRHYFDKYRSSQHQLEGIIKSLDHGQQELERDNDSIEQEKVNLWAVMGRLRQYAYLAAALDDALAARIATIEPTDPERAKVLSEDMLFSVRQKNQDLLTQLAVSVQGYLALDVIRRNNLELIKGVQRATTTTISALRTAVIVAQAMADQKLVLDQITALNTTTSNLIESTSEMLHQQSSAINEQAASATVDLARLQAAFTNIYATMDEIDTFKVQALDTMQKTVTALTTEITKSQAYLDRVRTDDTPGGPIDALGPGSIGADPG
ncbi:MAG TPA: toxic anion resistance protein [Candidatus Limnocylindrales bacterium]|nr:toxic anion resistance protein [Candidatus Limnocylindrales bacterium]